MNTKLSVLILSLIFTGACASPTYNYVPKVESFSAPPIGEIVTVSVGDEMLSLGTIRYQSGIEVPANTKVSGYTLHGGFYPQTGQSQKSTYHSFLSGTASPNGIGAMSKNVLMDPPQAVEAYLEEEKLCVVTILDLHTCRERSFTRTERTFASEDSFQQTLLYSGRAGDQVSLSYREFSGDVARPAFSNDVEYDLSISREIAYKGARIEILEASNTSITYKVLSNFR